MANTMNRNRQLLLFLCIFGVVALGLVRARDVLVSPFTSHSMAGAHVLGF